MKVTAIVPVYNEEKTVQDVLRVLDNSTLINEIIVVDDASQDNSVKKIQEIQSNKIKLISLKENHGKSLAVKKACEHLETDIIFFCDADLHNFNEKHIEKILSVFKDNEKAMSVGIRDYGPIRNFIAKYFFPLISGERALNFEIFKAIMEDEYLKDYAMEILLNDYCKRNHIKIYKFIMPALRQTNKPFKRKNGLYLLVKQSFDLFLLLLKLKKRNLLNLIKQK